MRKKIGFAMLAAPFIGIAVIAVLAVGLLPTLVIFGCVVAGVIWLDVAIRLAA